MHIRRFWLVTFGAIGSGSIAYVVAVRGFVQPEPQPGGGMGWLILGVLPLFVFGMWLLTATASPVAVYVALGATASAVGSAYETLLQTHPELTEASWYVYLNAVGLTADGLATVGFLLMLGSFPDGVLERRWQRLVLGSVWICAFVAPLTMLTMPYVVLPQYVGVTATVENPLFVPALAWAAPFAELVVDSGFLAALALVVLLSRRFGDDERTRSRLRVMTWTVLAVGISWGLWTLSPELGFEGKPLGLFVQATMLMSLLALPAAGIHGILRYGAYDVADADRARLVVRSSSAFITVLYAIGVTTPALIFFDQLQTWGAVTLTAITAVVLLPVRGWLERSIQRAVLGDRDHHLALLSELGARLEQAMELDEVLARLAEGVRRGLDASWVLVRVLGVDGEVAAVPTGVAGTVTGAAVATQDLIRGDQRLGVLELGPPLHGEYGADELALLQTVARQATTTVANVRLTARLGEQLEELSASRVRLITAQDEERRRIERNLHDGIQQSVVALIASLGLARQRLQRSELRPLELIELQDQAREMLTDLRELARGIHPQVLSDRGLVAAVESRSSRFPVPLAVIADERARAARFAPDIEAVAFYTVREALANVAKHSGASCARVSLSVVGDRLRVEVVDDGSGFAFVNDRSTPGGLTNIGDRVAAVGGRLGVDVAPGGGARLVVDLPLAGSMAESTDVPARLERPMAPDEDDAGIRHPALATDLPLVAHPVGESARA